MSAVNIEKVVEVLDDMRNSGIIRKFAIGGAFAAILYDEPISTVDIDIFFFLARGSERPILSLAEIYDYARKNGFTFDHEFVNIHGWLVQFVEVSKNELWKEAVEAAEGIKIESLTVPVIRPEFLIVMWLMAGRAKDYQKIAMFLKSGTVDRKKMEDILERHDLVVKWKKEKWRFIDEDET